MNPSIQRVKLTDSFTLSSILVCQSKHFESKRSFSCLPKSSKKSSKEFRQQIRSCLFGNFIWYVRYPARSRYLTITVKVYLTVGIQEKRFLDFFGDFCSVVGQLPPSASLSHGLEKQDDRAVTCGCLTDIWRGKYQGTWVSIKAYRAKPIREDVRFLRPGGSSSPC